MCIRDSDRGEVLDVLALDKVLSSGKVRYAAIDADIFKNTDSGEITGPMAPYLDLEKKHSGKLELLPHAAADTEHVSRVEGAKQAVDQIFLFKTKRRSRTQKYYTNYYTQIDLKSLSRI